MPVLTRWNSFLSRVTRNDEDILYGITDRANDGGVDAIHFVVNRSDFFRTKDSADGFKMNGKVCPPLQAQALQWWHML